MEQTFAYTGISIKECTSYIEFLPSGDLERQVKII